MAGGLSTLLQALLGGAAGGFKGYAEGQYEKQAREEREADRKRQQDQWDRQFAETQGNNQRIFTKGVIDDLPSTFDIGSNPELLAAARKANLPLENRMVATPGAPTGPMAMPNVPSFTMPKIGGLPAQAGLPGVGGDTPPPPVDLVPTGDAPGRMPGQSFGMDTVKDVVNRPKTMQETQQEVERNSEIQMLESLIPKVAPQYAAILQGSIDALKKGGRAQITAAQVGQLLQESQPKTVVDKDIIDPEVRSELAAALGVSAAEAPTHWSQLPDGAQDALDARRNRVKIAGTRPPQGTGGGAHSPVLPQMLGVSGSTALEGVDAQTQNIVKSLAEYKIALPTGMALRTPEWQRYLALASAYDPSFDATQYQVRQKIRNDFTSGKSSQNIRSLNTAVGHLGTLATAAAELGNKDNQWWNWLKNNYARVSGDPSLVKFTTAATAVEGELANVFKNTGATDQEIKAWRESLNANLSPAQLNAFVTQAVELLSGRLSALTSQYEAGMGKPRDFAILSAKSRKQLEDLGIPVDQLDPVVDGFAPKTPPAGAGASGGPGRAGGAGPAGQARPMPQLNEERIINGILAVWDGKNWVEK